MTMQPMATWTDDSGEKRPGRWFRKIDEKTGQPVEQLHTVVVGPALHDAVKGYVDMYVTGDDTIKRLMGQGWMQIPDPRVQDAPAAVVNTEPLDPEEEAAKLEARLAEIHARNDAARKEFHVPPANTKPAKR